MPAGGTLPSTMMRPVTVATVDGSAAAVDSDGAGVGVGEEQAAVARAATRPSASFTHFNYRRRCPDWLAAPD